MTAGVTCRKRLPAAATNSVPVVDRDTGCPWHVPCSDRRVRDSRGSARGPARSEALVLVTKTFASHGPVTVPVTVTTGKAVLSRRRRRARAGVSDWSRCSPGRPAAPAGPGRPAATLPVTRTRRDSGSAHCATDHCDRQHWQIVP